MDLALFQRDEAVKARLRKMVPVRLYTAGRSHPTAPRWAALLRDRFKTTAIPLYVVLTPDDREVGRAAFPGGSMEPLKIELLRLMDAALARHPGK